MDGYGGMMPGMMGGGMMGGMGGGMMGGMMMDPAVQPYLARSQYAMALMNQGTQTDPVRSPWQAAARVLQGGIGGYMQRQAMTGMQAVMKQQQQDAMNELGGNVGENPLPSQMPQQQPAQQPAQASPSPTAVAPAKVQALLADSKLGPFIQASSQKYGVAPPLIASQILRESGGDPNAVEKHTGATGLMQIVPSTATNPGFGMSGIDPSKLTDPATNIDFGTHYLVSRGQAQYGKNWDPNNLDQLSTVYGDYSGHAANYAPDVLAGAGLSTGGGGGAGPGATFMGVSGAQAPGGPGGMGGYAGQDAWLQLYREAQADAVSGNPYRMANARNKMAMATQMLSMGQMSQPFQMANGQYGQINLRTGQLSMTGEIPRPQSAAMGVISRVNQALSAGQKPDPGDLAQYPSSYGLMGWGQKTEFNPTLGRTITYTPQPAPAGIRPPDQLGLGGAAPAAPGGPPGAPAATPAGGSMTGPWKRGPTPGTAVPLNDDGTPVTDASGKPMVVPIGGGASTAPAPAPAAAPVPGVPATAPATPPVAGAGISGGTQIAPPAGVSQAIGDQLVEDQKTVNTEREEAYGGNAQDLRRTLRQIEVLGPQVATGTGGALQQDIAALGERLGMSPDQTKSLIGTSASPAELLNKNLMNLVGERVKEQGGVRAAQIFNLFRNALPSMESRPQTIGTMARVADMSLTLAQQHADGMQQYYNQQRSNYSRTGRPESYDGLTGYDQQFWGSHNTGQYVGAAMAAGGMPYNEWTAGMGGSDQIASAGLIKSLWPGEKIAFHGGPGHLVSGNDMIYP